MFFIILNNRNVAFCLVYIRSEVVFSKMDDKKKVLHNHNKLVYSFYFFLSVIFKKKIIYLSFIKFKIH